MKIKLVKHSSKSQKYRIFVPVKYFEMMGYAENDIVDVDIVVNSIHEENGDAESISDMVPYGVVIPMKNLMYVGKKLYYSINGQIVEYDGKRFEIDITTGKIKNTTNYARFV